MASEEHRVFVILRSVATKNLYLCLKIFDIANNVFVILKSIAMKDLCL